MRRPYQILCARLGYEFAREDLLKTALTHRSAGGNNNERLEFLGDAILSFVIADALYRRFPAADEGELSRLRANLVRGETLAEIARAIDLGDALLLGAGELKSGGSQRDSILAGALEAIIGAVYADGGIEPCRALVDALCEERLEALSPGGVVKDPKTRLQEYLQARKAPLPEYKILSIEGLDHAQVFQVECLVAGVAGPVTGEGSSRRRAEQDAAAKALGLLGVEE